MPLRRSALRCDCAAVGPEALHSVGLRRPFLGASVPHALAGAASPVYPQSHGCFTLRGEPVQQVISRIASACERA